MKPLAILLPLLLVVHATAKESSIRTIQNMRGLPIAPLRQMIKPQFFKSLSVSPVEAWVIVRGHIVNHRFAGARVVHSELDGKYDPLALEMVKNVELRSGWEPPTGSHISTRRVRFDVLVYKIQDGKMAIGFAQSDEAEGSLGYYYGPTSMATEKDGKWTWIKPGGA
jgi:hypothetical protein